MKFTAYELEGIRTAENSPLVSWLVAALGIRPFWNLLGVIEIATGVLAALRPISARASVIGSGMAIATFLTTLTFVRFLFAQPRPVQRLFARNLQLLPVTRGRYVGAEHASVAQPLPLRR